MTLAPLVHSDPSLIRATAVMRCVPARRMLVCTRAAPERGPKWKRTTFETGFLSEKM